VAEEAGPWTKNKKKKGKRKRQMTAATDFVTLG
jgi:hypothetical protein